MAGGRRVHLYLTDADLLGRSQQRIQLLVQYAAQLVLERGVVPQEPAQAPLPVGGEVALRLRITFFPRRDHLRPDFSELGLDSRNPVRMHSTPQRQRRVPGMLPSIGGHAAHQGSSRSEYQGIHFPCPL